MTISFIAVDVETSNADLASICQIGLASVREGEIADVWSQLINPQDWFDPINVSIHGIDAETICDAPTFDDVLPELSAKLGSEMAVSHTLFDRRSLARACKERGASLIESRAWLDSALVARRAWPDRYGKRGYGLANVAHDLGIQFKHHDAAEDATAAAKIVLRAYEGSVLDFAAWLQSLLHRPYRYRPRPYRQPIHREGDETGPLHGEIVCFTGALCIPRREAADRAAAIGCKVESGVTRRTTMLIVGDQDIQVVGQSGKSGKHRKAEALITAGQEIRIIGERDFSELAS